jgi:hypothetical protein
MIAAVISLIGSVLPGCWRKALRDSLWTQVPKGGVPPGACGVHVCAHAHPHLFCPVSMLASNAFWLCWLCWVCWEGWLRHCSHQGQNVFPCTHTVSTQRTRWG